MNGRVRYYLVYTVAFLGIAAVSYALYLVGGVSFAWKTDGATQHLPALVYLYDWAHALIASVASGSPQVPTWDISLGFGSDVLALLAYYGFADPFNWLVLLFPRDSLGLAYTVVALLRLYCAGLAFSAFVRHFRCQGWSSMVATLIYVFSGFALFFILRHPFFITPLVFLPLACLGAEFLFARRSPLVYVAALAWLFAANYYFSFMVSIFVFGYVVCRYVMVVGSWKPALLFGHIGRFLGWSLLAACLAAPVFVPAALGVFSSARTGAGHDIPLLYDAGYYLELFPTAVTLGIAGNQCYLGVTQLGVLAVALLFMQRGRNATVAKVGMALLLASVAIPWAGHMFNGFSYVVNRHSFGLVFASCALLARLLPSLFELEARQVRGLAVFSGVYIAGVAGACAWAIGTGQAASDFKEWGWLLYAGRAVMIAVAFVVTVLLVRRAAGKPGRRRSCTGWIVGLTMLMVAVNGFAMSTIYKDLMLSLADTTAMLHASPFEGKDAGQGGAAQDTLTRVDDGWLSWKGSGVETVPVARANEGLYDHAAHDTSYFSLLPSHVSTFLAGEMQMGDTSGYHYWHLDQRASLVALMGVGSWAGNAGIAPYGFSQQEDGLFAPDAEVPIGYTCAEAVERAAYQVLSPVDKQETLMQAVVVDDVAATGLNAGKVAHAAREVDAKVVADDAQGIEVGDGGSIHVQEGASGSVAIEFEPVENAELYVQFQGYRALSRSAANVSVHAKCGDRSAMCRFRGAGGQYYAGFDASMMFFGYAEGPRSRVEVTLPSDDEYSFDSVHVYALPVDDHAERAQALAAEHLQQVELAANAIRGTLDVSERKMLCMAIPYSSGWSATVDGAPVDVQQVNTWMCGIVVEPGSHQVEFTYRTPGLTLGLAAGAVGLAVLVVALLFRRKFANRA